MLGQTISTNELRARWAYGELTSTRFGHCYHPGTSPVLLDKARGKLPFQLLDDDEVEALVQLHARVRGPSLQFMEGIEQFGCEAWTRQQLLRLLALPAFDWQRQNRLLQLEALVAFLRFPVRLISAAEQVEVEAQSDRPSLSREPAVVGNIQGQQILIDGYLRCVLFLRSGEESGCLVWVPIQREQEHS